MEKHTSRVKLFVMFCVMYIHAKFIISFDVESNNDTEMVRSALYNYTEKDLMQINQTRSSRPGNNSIRFEYNCSFSDSFLHFTTKTADELIITLHVVEDNRSDRVMSGKCKVYITSPDSMILWFLFVNRNCSAGVYVAVSDGTARRRWDVCSYWYFPVLDFTSSNTVNMSIIVNDISSVHNVTIKVKTEPMQNDSKLEARYLSPTLGYVQSPHWIHFTEEGPRYLPNIDSWVRIFVPPYHQAMVTPVYMDMEASDDSSCQNDWLELSVLQFLYTGTSSIEKSTSAASKSAIERTTSYSNLHPNNKPKESVSMTSNARYESWVQSSRIPMMGQDTMASIENPTAIDLDSTDVARHDITNVTADPSQVPRRLANRTWNCSMPSWKNFEFHFRCNFRKECFDGEDEYKCPYTTCEHGGVAISGQCYVYVRNDVGLSWNDAQHKCRTLGAYLASLTSSTEWNDVMHWLQANPDWRGASMYLGLSSVASGMPYMYRHVKQWDDQTIAYFKRHRDHVRGLICSSMFKPNLLDLYTCTYLDASLDRYLCEKQTKVTDTYTAKRDASNQAIRLSKLVDLSVPFPHTDCPTGHFTQKFLAFDDHSKCWAHNSKRYETRTEHIPGKTSLGSTPLSTLFLCSGGREHIAYSLVCDQSPDCLDSSDEDFCTFPPCESADSFQCTDRQCLPVGVECNNIQDCRDNSDEERCGLHVVVHAGTLQITAPAPAVIHFDGFGRFRSEPLADLASCPETHFQCPGDGYCLPVYVRCNRVYDCPEYEDEEACVDYTCPSFYRCRGSTVCLHVRHLCDGWAQCPQHDDERFCNLTCPDACVCFGHSFICRLTFFSERYPQLRDLDGSYSGLQLNELGKNRLLIRLKLVKCGLTHLGNTVFSNLRSVDVSSNYLKSVTHQDLNKFPKMAFLSLSENPIVALLVPGRRSVSSILALHTLHLSSVERPYIDPRIFRVFPNLLILNLSYSKINEIHQEGFRSLKLLQTLDVRGCPLTSIPKTMFKGLSSLTLVFADNYKICCPATLPEDFATGNCFAPFDEISSCDALLRSHMYRVSLAVFATLAVLGNGLSFVYRVFYMTSRRQSGFADFVIHLCIADFFMGIYLVIIGVADRLYLDSYVWVDVRWKSSLTCKMAGFLSLLSSEVSALIVCLVTVDRFLVLRFPFSRLHFQRRSAQLVCSVVWAVGTAIAGVPLLPTTAHWKFYSQTGICIPLPVTRQDFPGKNYAFGVMIIFNFVIFLCISAGQISIYAAVRNQSMAGGIGRKPKDLAVARRLFTVVVSDFLCWFPVGLLGLIAYRDVPIPSEVNVSVAIFVLPLNSALNPFLYSLNAVQDRRSRAREEKLLKMVLAQHRLEKK